MHPSRDGASVHSGPVPDRHERGATVAFEYLDTGAILLRQGTQVVALSAFQFAELEAFYEQAKAWL